MLIKNLIECYFLKSHVLKNINFYVYEAESEVTKINMRIEKKNLTTAEYVESLLVRNKIVLSEEQKSEIVKTLNEKLNQGEPVAVVKINALNLTRSNSPKIEFVSLCGFDRV